MRNIIALSIRALIVFTLLTGVAYPLTVTGLAQLIFPFAANGSIVERNAKSVGSALLAQSFKKAEYFWSRPSTVDYGTLPGGASNLGPTSQKLKDRLSASMKELGVTPDSENKPYDLFLTSASGLDPHITPESAQFQAGRVATARGLVATRVATLIEANTEPSFLGLIGRPRVNVLNLNLALDQLGR